MTDAQHVDRTSDEVAIQRVLAELIWHADESSIEELDGYVACFTEDAEWEMLGDKRRGHTALRAGAEERRRAGTGGPGSNTRHFLGCILINFTGATAASVRSYVQGYRVDKAGPVLVRMGQYHDRFQRTDQGWKLASRKVLF